LAVLRAATVVAADLINVTDRGRLAEGQVADIIAVPGIHCRHRRNPECGLRDERRQGLCPSELRTLSRSSNCWLATR